MQLSLFDDWTEKEVYAYKRPYPYEWDGFSHGGTLKALICDFSDYIRFGGNTDGNNGHGGLHGRGWGHSDEVQQEIINYGKELGYIN